MAYIFSLILTLSTLITGVVWVIDCLKLLPVLQKKILKQKNDTNSLAEKVYVEESTHKLLWVDICASAFPILAIVLVIRSFIYEPFQIPSGSMMPTLLVGDFILVEKFAYKLANPVTQTTLLQTGKPKRGDIAVFKYPKDPSVNFIKRVVGLPSDKIVYDPIQKELRIYPHCMISTCAQMVPIIYSTLQESEWALFFNFDTIAARQIGSYQVPTYEQIPTNALRQAYRSEILEDISHEILVIPNIYTQSDYQQSGMLENEWIVPPKHYFMIGDNRDNSADSRMWGFVPEENLVGRAALIWFSLDKHEGKWPTGVRLSRIGTVLN